MKVDDGKTLSAEHNILVYPIYQNEDLVGRFLIDESTQKPVVLIGNQSTFVHEDEGIVTMQLQGCSLIWAECMTQKLGCGTWRGCLIAFGGCISACCACINPFACIGCGICVAVVLSAAWACRMCVVGAARPQECPVR